MIKNFELAPTLPRNRQRFECPQCGNRLPIDEQTECGQCGTLLTLKVKVQSTTIGETNEQQ